MCSCYRENVQEKQVSKTYAIKSLENDNVKIKQYTALKIKCDPKKEITDSDVQKETIYYLKSLDLFRKNYDSVVKDGDFVNIKFVGRLNGELFEGGSSDSYDVEIGTNIMIDNFEQQLIGHAPGDTFEVTVQFPADYSNIELAGKSATFSTTINYVKNVVEIPDNLTDSFVQENTEFKNLDELNSYIRQDLEQQEKEKQQTKEENATIDKLMDLTTVKNYPSDLLNEEINYLNDYYLEWSNNSGVDFNTFTQQLGYETQADYETAVEDSAKMSVKYFLICDSIAKKENLLLEEGDTEYLTYEQQLAEEYGYESVSDLEKDYDKKDIQETLIDRRVVDFVMQNSNFIYDSE